MHGLGNKAHSNGTVTGTVFPLRLEACRRDELPHLIGCKAQRSTRRTRLDWVQATPLHGIQLHCWVPGAVAHSALQRSIQRRADELHHHLIGFKAQLSNQRRSAPSAALSGHWVQAKPLQGAPRAKPHRSLPRRS